jgi:uncharacterized protein (DUF302 family)
MTKESTMSFVQKSSVQVSAATIAVEHVRITSRKPFSDVRAAIEAALPKLDETIIPLLSQGDQTRIRDIEENGPKLYIFLSRDHGALLAIAGRAQNAVKYEIGNPITATRMTRHQRGASLYAPLRVTLFETETGETVFEYDKPSTLFGQFGDSQVTDTARVLDRELEAALVKATT